MTAAIVLDDAKAQAAFKQLEAIGEDLKPMMQEVAGVLHDAVEENFRQEGRPKWTSLRPSTLRRRHQSAAQARILQFSGQLAASITPEWGKDYALVGTNKIYGPIQQFGGTIHRAPFSTRVRHVTDKAGNLVHQGKNGKLLRFAKDKAKLAKTRWFEVKPYDIHIPRRPFLTVTDDDLAKITAVAVNALKATVDKG